jgi:hypothetical protein
MSTPRCHAFVDETERAGTYMLAAVRVAVSQLASARTALRGVLLPGQRRLHMSDEGDPRRRQLLELYSHQSFRVDYYRAEVLRTGQQDAVRARLMAALAVDLAKEDVRRLVIESRQGRDDQDRAAVRAALGVESGIDYEHMRPYEEPLLWLADGLAWARGKGGTWAARVTCQSTDTVL